MTTLVVGPSLGTTAATCWGPTLALLPDDLDVVTFDLPGHTPDAAEVVSPLTVSHLATLVLDRVDGPFVYAGDSIGGQIGLQLLLDAPERVRGAVLCCTGARIGDEQTWTDRVRQVRSGGTAGLVEATRERWFGPGFADREPERAEALLDALRDTDDDGYAAACGALAAFDARDLLDDVTAPVVAVAGAEDAVCPPALLQQIADGVAHGRLVVLDGVGHQAPAEAPEEVARLIGELVRELGDELRDDADEGTS